MKALIFFLLSMVVLICFCASDYEPLSFVYTDKKLVVNGIWVYKDRFISLKLNRHCDTFTTFMFSKCYGDTFIDGKKYYSFQEKAYDPRYFEVDSSYSIFYVSYGQDSVIVLDRNLLKAIGIGRASEEKNKYFLNNKFKSFREFYNQLIISKLGIHSKFPVQNSPAAFADRYYPVVFPLVPGNEWYYRPKNNPNGHLPIKRKFLGDEIVYLPAGAIASWKMEWDWSPIPWDDMIGYDWWTEFGLIKSYFDFGLSYIKFLDEDGNWAVDTFQVYRIMEFYGEDSLLIPNVKPYLSEEQIDHVTKTVSKSWDLFRFREWYDTLANYCKSHPGYIKQLGTLQDEVWYLIAYVWGDTNTLPVDSQVHYLNSHTLPTKKDDFRYYYGFIELVVEDLLLVQGWTDCDFDWNKNNKPFSKITDEFFVAGKSKLRKELEDYIFNR